MREVGDELITPVAEGQMPHRVDEHSRAGGRHVKHGTISKQLKLFHFLRWAAAQPEPLVALADDDVFISMPKLTALSALLADEMRRDPGGGGGGPGGGAPGLRKLYVGKFEFYSWHPRTLVASGWGRTLQEAWGHALVGWRNCSPSGGGWSWDGWAMKEAPPPSWDGSDGDYCQGPLAFAKGPLLLLSKPLIAEIVGSAPFARAEAASRAFASGVGLPTAAAKEHPELLLEAGSRDVLEDVSRHIRPWVPILSLAKGLEPETNFRMTEVIRDMLPEHRAGALSGPNLAKEIMAGMAAASVVAFRDDDIARQLQLVFNSGLFRCYTNRDVVGCELGGALKNVIAIATGMGDGLGVGDNTRSAIITRGLAELTRLGVAMGGDPATFAGLAGMGDLIATCTSKQSRNRHVGEELGKGRNAPFGTTERHRDTGAALEEPFARAKRCARAGAAPTRATEASAKVICGWGHGAVCCGSAPVRPKLTWKRPRRDPFRSRRHFSRRARWPLRLLPSRDPWRDLR